jgi:hypothetical protein
MRGADGGGTGRAAEMGMGWSLEFEEPESEAISKVSRVVAARARRSGMLSLSLLEEKLIAKLIVLPLKFELRGPGDSEQTDML